MRSALVLILVVLSACQSGPTSPTFRTQELDTDALFQAISIVDERNVWISGHTATYAYSTDGGATWISAGFEGEDTLQWRDIEAFSIDEVLLLGAGPGAMSQIRKTNNRGKDWEIAYQMEHPEGFLDCMSFWDENVGIAYGDQIDGKLFLLKTTDGGNTWSRIPGANVPPAEGTEGGFAASGTCVETAPGGIAWIGTGAGDVPRVLLTEDYGETWQAVQAPLVSGEAAGITSINFWDKNNGVIVGGNLVKPDSYTNNVALTSDGGLTWSLTKHPFTKGAFYGADVTNIDGTNVLFACGPNGIDYTIDNGASWINLDTANYWAIEFHSDVGWAVGKEGNIIQIKL